MDKSKQGAEVRKDRAISSSKERRSKDSDVIMHAVYGCVCMHVSICVCRAMRFLSRTPSLHSSFISCIQQQQEIQYDVMWNNVIYYKKLWGHTSTHL